LNKEGKIVKLEIPITEFDKLLDSFLARLFSTEKAIYVYRGFKELTAKDIRQYYAYLLYDFLTNELGVTFTKDKEREKGK